MERQDWVLMKSVDSVTVCIHESNQRGNLEQAHEDTWKLGEEFNMQAPLSLRFHSQNWYSVARHKHTGFCQNYSNVVMEIFSWNKSLQTELIWKLFLYRSWKLGEKVPVLFDSPENQRMNCLFWRNKLYRIIVMTSHLYAPVSWILYEWTLP